MIENETVVLLETARQRKLQGETGYGDLYRRAAWSVYHEQPGNLDQAELVLQELLSAPETAFDVYDSYRMLGQMHAGKRLWADAIDFYGQAKQIGETTPSMAADHPLLTTSIWRGLSMALLAHGDPAGAALIDIQIRDHQTIDFSQIARKNAALRAAENFLRANDHDACVGAWDQFEQQFPERFAGREGVFWHMERAGAIASFQDDLATQLELVWNQPDVREFDTGLHVVLALSTAWLQLSDIPTHKEFAHGVLGEGWATIQQHEAEWIAGYQGDQEKIDSLRAMTRMIIADLVQTGMELGRWNEALPVAQAYLSRHGDTDARAAQWVSMIQNEMP